MFTQYENKKNNNTNRIYQLRKNIVPKLININESENCAQSIQIDNFYDYTYIYYILFKSQDTFEVLELYLKDTVKFKKSFGFLIRFYLRVMIKNLNMNYPDSNIEEDKYNYAYLETQYYYDEQHEHFKSQYKFIQSTILKYIVYLYDEYFIEDLINEDYQIYQNIRSKSITQIEQNLSQINYIFNKSDIGSPYLNYFQNTRYDNLALVKNYTSDLDIELSIGYFNLLYDGDKLDSESLNPSNTSRFFKILEGRLHKEDGYSQIRKNVVIGKDKLINTALEKISRTYDKDCKQPYFYNIVKDLKRFTFNFQDEFELKNWSGYLSKSSMFGENLSNELKFQTQIKNYYGGLDTFNYKVHVKSVKNMFATNDIENTYKDIKIIFEVYVIESDLVFQVELQCNLQAFADWKATDHIFYDIHRKKDEFNQIKGDYQEYLWYESNSRIIVIILLNLVLFLGFFFIFILCFFLDDCYEMYYKQFDRLDINSLRYLGQKHKKLGNYSLSMKYYKKIDLNENHNDEDLYMQALIYIDNKKYDYAILNLQILISNDTNNPNYYIKLAEIYLNYYINYYKSIEYYKKVIKISPSNTTAYNGLGNAYLKINLLDKAMASFDKAIELDPNYIQAQINKGSAYFSINQLENALISFQSAIEIDPSYTDIYIQIGIVYYVRMDYETSLITFDYAIKIDHKNIKAYIAKGYVYQMINNQDNAILSFLKAIEIEKYNVEALYGIGSSLILKADYDNAIMYFEKVLLIDSKFLNAYIQLGIIFKIKNDINTSIKHFEKSLEIDSNDISALLEIGSIYFNLKNYDKAIMYFCKVIEIDPKFIDAHIEIGKIMIIIKEYDKGIQSFQFVIKLDPNNIYAHVGIGYILKIQNKIEESKKYFDKSIKIDPNNYDAKRGMSYFDKSSKIKLRTFYNFLSIDNENQDRLFQMEE